MFADDDDRNNIWSRRNRWFTSPWRFLLLLCCMCKVLFSIAAVIIISLIPLYLSRKGDGIKAATDTGDKRLIYTVYAVNSDITESQAITNLGSIGAQTNQFIGYSPNILTTASANYYVGPVTNIGNRRRKREVQSCFKTSCETSHKLVIGTYINACPHSNCRTSRCLDACVPKIKTEIQSKMPSTPFLFSITKADGTSSTILAQFCSLDHLVPVTTTTVTTAVAITTVTTAMAITTVPTAAAITTVTTATAITTTQKPTCCDGITNGNETDVDCGGNNCSKCIDGKVCTNDADCLGHTCAAGKCWATCTDGIQNQDETSIDCGGSCPNCKEGATCKINEDCADGCSTVICINSICTRLSMFSANFVNGDFERGDANGWTIGGGDRRHIGTDTIDPAMYLPDGVKYNSIIASRHSAIVKSGLDPNLGDKMPNIVYQGNYSFRVEDVNIGSYISVIQQKIASYICTDIYFAWLAVLENGGHTANESALVTITLTDKTTNETLINRRYNAGAGGSSVDTRFQTFGNTSYTPQWQIEHIPIDYTRTGHDFQLLVAAMDCALGGHRGYIYLDAFGGNLPVPNQ
ncbi:unnamed protein product [Adineta ricciae]|uniref:Uncharacterized protein n=2 Tax=Adineta ricciae TaxID=249248 RepID=A0A815UNZ7_ADIRI|nr:unnamed protein product [Adineta ricciae]